MHAVVNHLSVARPPTSDVVADLQERALVEAAAIPGILDVHLVQVDERHLVMIIVGEDLEALGRLSEEVGSPWVQEHLGPLFVSPPNRVVGEVLATTHRRMSGDVTGSS